MRVIANQAQTERKRLARSVCCPEKPGGYRRMTPVHGLMRPNRRPRTAVAVIRSTERLTRRQRQDKISQRGRPLGECRRILLMLRRHAHVLRRPKPCPLTPAAVQLGLRCLTLRHGTFAWVAGSIKSIVRISTGYQRAERSGRPVFIETSHESRTGRLAPART